MAFTVMPAQRMSIPSCCTQNSGLTLKAEAPRPV